MNKMTYKGAGIDYQALDEFTREANAASNRTAKILKRKGFKEIEDYGHGNTHITVTPLGYVVHASECLGSKTKVAEAMYPITGKTSYDVLAQDIVNLIVNEIVATGAMPDSIIVHTEIGDMRWLKDQQRRQDFLRGLEQSCESAQCFWKAGEPFVLNDIIHQKSASIIASGMGSISARRTHSRLLEPSLIGRSNHIVIFESNGIHARGFSMARKIAKKLPEGYRTPMRDGTMFGEALLRPTISYMPVMEELAQNYATVYCATQFAGQGWLNLAEGSNHYNIVIEHLPKTQPIFEFLLENGPISLLEAYKTFNMGAGFAVFAADTEVERIIAAAKKHGIRAFYAGHLEKSKSKKERKIVIKPLGISISHKN